MLAARFRSVYWVALASVAGLGCYMVTQRVAAERASLEKLERDIRRTRLSIRDLETELGTRGSMAQMERWNADVLDLRAANSAQFVPEGVQLASLNASPMPDDGKSRPGLSQPAKVVQAKAEPPAAEAQPSAPQPSTPQPMLRNANYLRPAGVRMTPLPQRVAMRSGAPLDAGTVADLDRLARAESDGGSSRQ